jgi:kanamycin kinase
VPPEREPPTIPPAALQEMAGWESTVVWAFAPDVVTWRLRAPHGEVRYLKVARRGREIGLGAESERLRWAARLPVPRVLREGVDGEREWLLTAALPGVNATDTALTADPPRLVPLLAQGLRRFHALEVEGCPFDGRLEATLATVRHRLAAGLTRQDGPLRPEHGVSTPGAALDLLIRRRPPERDLVVCHGDYCLPNVLIEDWRVSGFVDLGALAVADRWRDLAVATWSVTWNLGPGWEDLFLEAYGVPRDEERQAYYRLLYDLLP